MIEGESLVAAARATAGRVQEQELSGFETASATWSRARHLWWVEGRPGARLTLPLRAPAAGTYTVRSGDTLSGIARRNGTSWQTLYAANRDVVGPDPGRIRIGQQLRLG